MNDIDDTNEDCEELIASLRGTMSEGQAALEGLLVYLAQDLPPPAWVLQGIAAGYERFRDTRESAGWAGAQSAPPRTLGEAFQVPDHVGKHLRLMRLRVEYTARVVNALEVLGAKRTPEGRKQVAEALGLTERQVRDLLPKTRTNTRGHKSYKVDRSPGSPAHNPFGL